MLSRGDRIGEYVLLNKVGSGGFGDVWKAEKRTALDINYFALKFFRPKDDQINFENIRKELAVWKQLRGLGNIISVIELDRFEDFVYVVSDFADGGSLENWFKQNGKASSEAEAVEITLQILKGLENLHEKGFVHRDLKPDNLLIMNGKLCLADFGISREVKTYSKATGTAGTVEYMPPEAFEKNPPVTTHTDIWAIGVILQRLLTGELAFPQEMPALMLSILQDEPEPMPETISKGLREIVKKALQKKRENRFQSAREMREALKNPTQFLASIPQTEAKTIVDEDFERTKVLENVPTFVNPQSKTKDQNQTQLEKEAAERQRLEFIELERARQWREVEAEKERQRLRDLEAKEKEQKRQPDSKQDKPQEEKFGKIFDDIFSGAVQNQEAKPQPNQAQATSLKSNKSINKSDFAEWKLPAAIILICITAIFIVANLSSSKSDNFDKTKGRFSNNLVFNSNNSNRPANNSYSNLSNSSYNRPANNSYTNSYNSYNRPANNSNTTYNYSISNK